ncbi:amidohydrolase family protein [Nocardia asteroides]|uniref:amidohydrolase family protein n=1 Tax=Nocardia asteroides TaxID=1824 RepID=UPI0034159F85
MLDLSHREFSISRRSLLIGTALAPLTFAVSCSADRAADAVPERALTHVRLIDGTGAAVVHDATVVLSGDRIVAAGTNIAVSDTAEVIDGQGMTVLPGLIDAHVHLGGRTANSGPAFGGKDLTDNYAAVRQRSLQYGVTTVRSLGDFLDDSLALREDTAQGRVLGPRIVASGPSFQIKGGHPNGTVWANDTTTLANAARMPGTPAEASQMVDELAAKGVDVIKVIRSSMVMPTGGSTEKLPWNTVEAITTAAHRNNLKVAVHVEDPEDTLRAVEIGADDIEHMYVARTQPLADESVYDDAFRLMAANGTVVTPTMVVNVHSDTPLDQLDLRTLTAGNKLIRRAFDHGVTLAVGSDAHVPDLQGRSLHAEIVMMVNDQGIPALSALEAATSTNATLLGLSDRLGTVEAGKLADLLVVSGNPAENIVDLQNVRMVIQGGKIVVDNTK